MLFRILLSLITLINFSFAIQNTYYQTTKDSKTLITLDDKVYVSVLKKDGSFRQNSGVYSMKDTLLSLNIPEIPYKNFIIQDREILALDENNKTTKVSFKLVDKEYYKSYLGKYKGLYGTAIIQQSSNDSISFEFYPNFERQECQISQNISLKNGLIIGNSVLLNSLNSSNIFLLSKNCPQISGKYTGDQNHRYTITRHSLGLIHKDVKVSEILNSVPKNQISKNGDDVTVLSSKGKELFSFKHKDNKIKSIEILNSIYKTPNGISLDSGYDYVKKLNFTQIKDEKYIILRNYFLNLFVFFDPKEVVKDQKTAKPKKLILEW